MATMRAVAKHQVGADKPQIRRELLEGLEQCVYELLEAGATLGDVESAVESAQLDYDSDHEGKEAEL